jgi:hypothetical protein
MSDEFDFVDKISPSFSGPNAVKTIPDLSEKKQPSLDSIEENTKSDDMSFLDDLTITKTPSLSEKAEQVRLGIMEEYPKAAFSLLSGIEAAKVGAKVPGPAPVKILSGTGAFLAGTTAGYYVSDEVVDLLDEEFDLFPIPSREKLIPYREGGKTTGAALAGFPAVYRLPAKATGRISQWLSSIKDFAVKNPKQFLTIEGLAALGSGVVVKELSEAAGPEENYKLGSGERFLGEVSGGLLLGNQFIARSGFTILNALKSRLPGLKKNALDEKAANKLIELIEEAGENPQKILRLLQEETGYSSLTSAQKTGSSVLSLLEKQIVQSSPVYTGTAVKNAEKTQKEILGFIRQLEVFAEKNNSPVVFKEAVKLRKNYLDNMLAARVDLAFANAARAISKITDDSPSARAEIGEIVKTQVNKSLEAARLLEKSLWSKAYKSGYSGMLGSADKSVLLNIKETKPRKLIKQYLDLVGNMDPDLEYADIPKNVKNFFEKLGVTPEDVANYRVGKASEGYIETGVMPDKFLPNFDKVKNVPINQLVDVRSSFLRIARNAAADTASKQDGRFFGTLAEATLDDLSNPALGEQYDIARNFSRKLNDVYTRTFIDDIKGVRKTGREKIPAELVVGKAFGANSDINALRMNQIEESVTFLINQNKLYPEAAQVSKLKEATDRYASIRDAQSRVLRLAANNSIEQKIDPVSGESISRVNVKKLNKFIEQNKELLTKTEVIGDLKNAATAENLLLSAINQNSALNKRIQGQQFFLKALDYDSKISPVDLIAEAINSKKPLTNINQLVKTAKQHQVKTGTSAAVDGLKSTIMDYAFLSAMSRNNVFSPANFNQAFFEPIKPSIKGQKGVSLSQVLRANGLMSGEEISNLKKLLVPMIRAQRAMAVRGTGSDIIYQDEASAVADFFMRSVGAKIGSDVGGGTLIAASAGSKAIRNVFDKMPKLLTSQVIEEAIKDPKFMALLLKKGTSDKELFKIAQGLNGWLYGAGLTFFTPDDEYPEEEIIQEDLLPKIEPTSMDIVPGLPRNVLRGPRTRGTEMPDTGIDSKLLSSAKPTRASNQSSRQMLQSLFPLDPILGAGRPPTA